MLEDLNPVEPRALRTDVSLLDRQQAFGYTQEDLTFLLAPMAATGQEAVGSMGTDTPISALSSKSKLLYTYFKQNFAQVTNPPIDPIREELVMSLVSFIGPRPNLFDLDGAATPQAPRGAPADPDQRGPREDPQHRSSRGFVRHQNPRHHLSGRRRARPAWTTRSSGFASARKRRCMAATTSSSCPTAWSVRIASRSRPCSPRRPCTIT